MSSPLTRRAFLKLGAASLGGMAFKLPPWLEVPEGTGLPHHPKPVGKGRVTIDTVYIYQEPNFKSQRVGLLRRDKIVNLYEELNSPNGPKYNPRWYRVQAGFAHSAYLQRVEVKLQPARCPGSRLQAAWAKSAYLIRIHTAAPCAVGSRSTASITLQFIGSPAWRKGRMERFGTALPTTCCTCNTASRLNTCGRCCRRN